MGINISSIIQKNNIKFLFFLFLLFNLKIEGQKKGVPIYTEEAADNILSKNKKNGDLKKLNYNLYAFSRYFNKKNNTKLAIKYAKKHIAFLEEHNKINESYQKVIYFLGTYFMKKEEYGNAIYFFKKSSNLDFSLIWKAKALCKLGTSYKTIGEYNKSITFLVRGIEILKNIKNDLNNSVGNVAAYSINLAATCNIINNKKQLLLGVKYLNTADSLLTLFPKFNTTGNHTLIHNALATLHTSKEIFDLKKSKKFYFKALKEAHNNDNSFLKVLICMNIGDLYLKTKNDSALLYLNKSLDHLKNKNIKTPYGKKDSKKTTISEIYRNLSIYYSSKGLLKKALQNVQKSINSSFEIDSNLNIYPTKTQFSQTRSKRNILKSINLKNQILLKLFEINNKKIKYLYEINLNIKIGDELVKLILSNSTEKETKFLWRKDISQIYFMGSYTSHLLNDQTKVFKYLEKNKAFLLSQSVNQNIQKVNLPYSISKKDLNYKKDILAIEDEIEEGNSSKNIKDSLFSLKLNYQNFNDSIKNIYPDYFKIKDKVRQISLKEVKNQLDDNTIVISYGINTLIENKKAIVGLLISKEKTISFKVDNPKNIISKLETYRSLISKPLSNKKELSTFKNIAFELYNNLLPTKEIKQIIKGKNLLIIPDNELQNIPFESLSTDNKSVTFLIDNNNISYANSMSFLNINKNIKRDQKKDFIGFAPIHFNNKKLTSLEYSKKEISSIDDLLNVNSYIENNATKTKFLETSNNAKIIHLATHANISQKPVIYFNKDSLKLHELYTYKNNADLVVLSACETNLGEIKKGEGVLSLARGFFYSGANSVISSLWKVNDASSSSIMTTFYTNLKNKQTKAAALNNAKRKYLKEHSLSEKSPYYWASFILIGDTNQTFKYNYTPFYIILFTLLIISFIFFSKKRR